MEKKTWEVSCYNLTYNSSAIKYDMIDQIKGFDY